MPCVSPITLSPYKNYRKYIQVPCGKCSYCLAQRTKDLALRLESEGFAPDTTVSFFVTLTYRTECLNLISDEESGQIYYRLNRKDVQLYHKRLRKNLDIFDSEIKFKYLLSGEYGDSFNRPHYHAVYFFKNKKIDLHVLRYFIEKSWKLGFVRVEYICSSGAYTYVAKYCQKQLGQTIVDILKPYKPFIVCSQNLGINLIDSVPLSPLNTTVSNISGVSQKLPRYYKDKLVRLGRWSADERFLNTLSSKAKFKLYEKLELRKCKFDWLRYAKEYGNKSHISYMNELIYQYNFPQNYGYEK